MARPVQLSAVSDDLDNGKGDDDNGEEDDRQRGETVTIRRLVDRLVALLVHGPDGRSGRVRVSKAERTKMLTYQDCE